MVSTSKDQGGVESGFLKDPLFLASSWFIKQPERIIALTLIIVLCPLVYRLGELRLHTRLAQAAQTVPDQFNQPMTRPRMRGIFQCSEGIEHLHIHSACLVKSLLLPLQPIHRLLLFWFGPPYEKISLISL